MTKNRKLFLHEEAMLLALRDEKGSIEKGAWYNTAVGGAVLAELLLAERIRLVRRGKKEVVELTSSTGLGNEIVDESLQRIAADPKKRTLAEWVQRIAGKKDLKHRVALGLCRRGILRAEEDKVLLVFSRKIYPELDPRPEREILGRLEHAIFTDTSELDARTVVLLSLASGTGLLLANFDKKKLKARKERIASVIEGESAGRAAKQVVQGTQAALAAIVVCTTVATT